MTIMALQCRYLRAGRTLLLAAVLLAASGCVLPATGREGTRHYIVLGVGIVSIPGLEVAPPVTVAKLQAVGMVAELLPTARFALGYINSHRVEVDANTDSTVELSDAIGGPVKVSTSSPDSQEHDP